MDKEMMNKEMTKLGLLNGRYLLNECLFANELGHLYHARDTRHSTRTAPGANVLVHLFPSHAISYSELAKTFKQLQGTINASPCPVLPVLDYGWAGGSGAYFVMATTGSWSAKILPDMQSEPSNLHKKASRLTSELLKQQLISRGLVSQAFLVIPGGVKILGTALTQPFQKIQLEMNLLPTDIDHRHRSQIASILLGLGISAGIAAAGGTYFYKKTTAVSTSAIKTPKANSTPASAATPGKKNQTLPTNTPVETPITNAQEQEKADTSLSQQDKPLPTTNSSAINTPTEASALSTPPDPVSKPEPGTRRMPTPEYEPESIYPESEPATKPIPTPEHQPMAQATQLINIKPTDTTEPTTPQTITPPKADIIIQARATPEPELLIVTEPQEVTPQTTPVISMESTHGLFPAVEFPNKKLVIENTDPSNTVPLDKQPEAQTALADVIQAPEPSKTKEEKRPQQAARTRPAPKIDREKLTANGLNRNQLIAKAYTAIKKENLSEQPGSGSIYYIRLLKRISPRHPQIRRLAREVVSAYHVKARTSLKLRQTNKASQHLWIAGRIIEEFNLSQIKKTHIMLKQRFDE